MQGDSESRLPGREEPDLWRLPVLDFVEVLRVRYMRPRTHTVRGETIVREDGVEILIHTDEPIPIRALSPALFVGDEEVTENEIIGRGLYRFFVQDEDRLKPGAPIRLGWVGMPPARTKKRQGETFKYESPSQEVSEISLQLRRED